ncbi:MAG: outer membrane protein transport protein [Desulfuromonadaceae bacterium]|nr:outer membrane protein transport protein [Desulfuromonadaceae bacterium]
MTVLLVALPGLVFGAGFHIREQGAKAMGMANAFVAQADDPSAIFYNPAGIAFQSGMQVSLGVTVINVPETEFKGTTWLGDNRVAGTPGEEISADTKARDDIFFPPNFYATYSDKDSPWAFGIGVGSLYPLAKRWDTTSPFRDEVKEIAIKPINVNPTVAYRFEALNLAVGVGVDYTYTEVWLEKDAYVYNPLALGPTAAHIASTEVEGDGDGWGYNFGLLWKPMEVLSIAVAYRSEIELDIDGDADFYVTPTGQAVIAASLGVPSSYIPITASSSAKTEITLPDTWSFAVAWKPIERLTVEFDADRFGWSSYDELDIDLGTGSPVGDSPAAPKNWNDVWAYRFGVQFAVTENLDLRAGYTRDNNPIPNDTIGPELPDSDRNNYTFGFGYHTERAVFDFAYMWVDFDDRDVDNDIQSGTYESDAHLFAANLTYFF